MPATLTASSAQDVFEADGTTRSSRSRLDDVVDEWEGDDGRAYRSRRTRGRRCGVLRKFGATQRNENFTFVRPVWRRGGTARTGAARGARG